MNVTRWIVGALNNKYYMCFANCSFFGAVIFKALAVFRAPKVSEEKKWGITNLRRSDRIKLEIRLSQLDSIGRFIVYTHVFCIYYYDCIKALNQVVFERNFYIIASPNYQPTSHSYNVEIFKTFFEVKYDKMCCAYNSFFITHLLLGNIGPRKLYKMGGLI